MSDAARRARRKNLSKSRLRSEQESLIIKLLIWQSCFDGEPRPSQRTLALRLGVWPSYVSKIQKQAGKGLDILNTGQRATLDDLDKARGITARLKQTEPGLFRGTVQSSQSEGPRVMTGPQAQAEPVATIPVRPVLEGHSWNCQCAGCEMNAVIEAARSANGPFSG
jgi:hypothetical protein